MSYLYQRMQRYMTRMEETAKQAESFIQKNNLKNPSEIKAAALKFVLAMEKYAKLETPKADSCRNCAGLCEQSCPYGVPIQGLLNIAHTQLTLA